MAMDTFFAVTSPARMVIDWQDVDGHCSRFEVQRAAGDQLAASRGSDSRVHGHSVGIMDGGSTVVARRRYHSQAAGDFTYEIGCQIGVGPNNRAAHFWGMGFAARADVTGGGATSPRAKAKAKFKAKAKAKAIAARAKVRAKAKPKAQALAKPRARPQEGI